MVIFSIICLVVILFAIQHLLNWMWRKGTEDVDLITIKGVATIIGLLFSWGIICQIIEWGKQL